MIFPYRLKATTAVFIGYRWFLGLWLLGWIHSSGAPLPPPPTRYVTDGSGVLSANIVAQLNQQLDQLERSAHSQVVVWIEPRIPADRDLEGYVLALFRAWKIGDRQKNNGILLAVFTDDRKVRIETGYGLEGALPDALAGRIIQDEITPRFREGKYSEGIQEGVAAITQAIRGEYRGTGRTRANQGQAFAAIPVWWFLAGGALGALIRLITTRGDGWSRRIFRVLTAIPVGAIGFPATAILGLGGLVIPAIIVGGFVLLLLGCFPGRGTSFDRRGRHDTSPWNSWGGMGPWSGGGGWGSSGGSWGGFSGGGGSSGGGGASGSW